MSIIGGALKIGGAIAGGLIGAASARKQQRMLNQQEQENKAWYNRRYNELGTERADAQAALTSMREAQKARTQSARGAAAVGGGSGESAATEKAAANSAIGNVVSQINASADNRKSNIESQYRATQQSIDNAKLQLEQQRAKNMSAAASQMASAGDSFGIGGLQDLAKGNGK